MSIKKRNQRLELTNGPELVIYIADHFTGEVGPIVHV